MPVRLDPDSHTGCRPAGPDEAGDATGLVVPLDVGLKFDGHGYLLYFTCAGRAVSGVLWHPTEAAAERAARELFGVRPEQRVLRWPDVVIWRPRDK